MLCLILLNVSNKNPLGKHTQILFCPLVLVGCSNCHNGHRKKWGWWDLPMFELQYHLCTFVWRDQGVKWMNSKQQRIELYNISVQKLDSWCPLMWAGPGQGPAWGNMCSWPGMPRPQPPGGVTQSFMILPGTNVTWSLVITPLLATSGEMWSESFVFFLLW